MDWILLVLLRSLLLFTTVYLVFRVMGKRVMAQLAPIDKVAGVALGTIAGSAVVNFSIPLGLAIVAVFAFGGLSWAFGRVSSATPRLRRWLTGTPTLLVAQGQVTSAGLRRAGLNRDDLIMRLRELQIGRLSDVELAQLEIDGQLGLVKAGGSDALSKNPKSEASHTHLD